MVPAFRADDYAGGLNAAADRLMARIRGEALPAPTQRQRQTGAPGGLQIEHMLLFFFVAVPVLGRLLTGVFGRKFGSLVTAGAAGGVGWWLTASVLVGAGAAAVAVVAVGLLGMGSALRGAGGLPYLGGLGGLGGGGGGGGGFSSGGGGDFGGGGASGDW